jgi:putative sterol carrier protein
MFRSGVKPRFFILGGVSMNKLMGKQVILGGMLAFATSVANANNFMDEAWAKKACAKWNQDKTLTSELYQIETEEGDGYSWIGNDGDRGYKIVQMYRSECGEASKIQLNIVSENEQAICKFGGKPDGKALDNGLDYIMHATDEDWACMGKGGFGCGAMGAMMTGKLKFKGPKFEAMKVMGPFEAFLQMTDEVDSSSNTGKENCPA